MPSVTIFIVGVLVLLLVGCGLLYTILEMRRMYK